MTAIWEPVLARISVNDKLWIDWVKQWGYWSPDILNEARLALLGLEEWQEFHCQIDNAIEVGRDLVIEGGRIIFLWLAEIHGTLGASV